MDRGLDPKKKAQPGKRFKQRREKNELVLAVGRWQDNFKSEEQFGDWKEGEPSRPC